MTPLSTRPRDTGAPVEEVSDDLSQVTETIAGHSARARTRQPDHTQSTIM